MSYKQYLPTPCPKCKAFAGDHCIDIDSPPVPGTNKHWIAVNWVHIERMRAHKQNLAGEHRRLYRLPYRIQPYKAYT